MTEQNNPAKFAFYYLLALVALIFMSLSTGIIIFQIINKNIVDILATYNNGYSSGALKFAISALIIAAPIFYTMMVLINKNLFKGHLDKDSGVRRWLTYLILLISSVVMIGYLIGTIYSFLEGDLTTKFILKALTAIAIATTIFTYYFYDIRREKVIDTKDKVVSTYFYSTLTVVVISLISAFVFVESPTETRNMRYDNQILSNFDQIHNAIQIFVDDKGEMPQNLDDLLTYDTFLSEQSLTAPGQDKRFDFNLISTTTYELCADFITSNKDAIDNNQYSYLKDRWPHDSGFQCVEQNIREKSLLKDGIVEPFPVR